LVFIPVSSCSIICTTLSRNFTLSRYVTIYLIPALLVPGGWKKSFTLPSSYFIMLWSEQLSWSYIVQSLMSSIAWLFRIVRSILLAPRPDWNVL
jgi:hypothetical protein